MPQSNRRQPVQRAVVLDQPEQIAKFQLATVRTYARARAKGIHLTRRGAAPTLARLRVRYGVVAGSWAKMADELDRKLVEWEEHGVPEHVLKSFR